MKKNSGQFKKGQPSANPNGRPRGSSPHAKWRALIAKDMPKILATVSEMALNGDTQAQRMLLERGLPALKPVSTPVSIRMEQGSSLTEQAQTVVDAVTAGSLPADEGSTILSSLTSLAKITEVQELAEKIEMLQKRIDELPDRSKEFI